MSRSTRAALAIVTAILAGALSVAALTEAGSTAAPDLTERHPVATLLPPLTGAEQPVFGDTVSAVNIGAEPSAAPVFTAPGISVSFLQSPAPEAVCFRIELAESAGDGCIDRSVLQTGLAYNAFQDHGGPIHIIGIVPDDVATVSIDGTTIEVHHNVWYYAGRMGDDLSFTVHSADGVTSAAVG